MLMRARAMQVLFSTKIFALNKCLYAKRSLNWGYFGRQFKENERNRYSEVY